MTLGALFGMNYSKKKFRIACQEQGHNVSWQAPGPVYEEINLENTSEINLENTSEINLENTSEINLENTSGNIDLSKNVAYECARNMDY